MYQDQDSIKVFERLHARDRAKEFARRLGDDNNSDDLDIFGGHARAERREGRASIVLSFVTVAVLLGAFLLVWK